MDNMKFCQSCAMPMTEELCGTNADGGKSRDYCCYCYKDGKFTSECTMDEMIDFCAGPMADNNPGMTKEQAAEQMKKFFPALKRWSGK